jgi:hypothetical protein
MKIQDSGVLVKTGSAAPILGVSVQTLRSYRDLQGGFLIEGKHWFSGAFKNSPIRWDIDKCKEALAKRRKGFSKYQDFAIAKKIMEDQQK